jgi:hypothetical protein
MFGASLRPDSAALAIVVMLLFLIFVFLFLTLTAQPAQGQILKNLHIFSGGADGNYPVAGLIMDAAGNLYGTTYYGGYFGGNCGGYGCGTVFRLSKHGSNWVATPLYSFRGDEDGANPSARVIFGPHGALYGTTEQGGLGTWGTCGQYHTYNGCGTVFSLTPPATPCKAVLCPWTKTILYTFTGVGDGGIPEGDLTFDGAGDLYGTTEYAGNQFCYGGCGVVFKLASSSSGWVESVIYSFTGTEDGENPSSGVIFDDSGNLYGTTSTTVFQLSNSGERWTENTLVTLPTNLLNGLIFDRCGNLYGSALSGWDYTSPVFELSPSSYGWIYSLLYQFNGNGPSATVTMDAARSLYGTLLTGGAYGRGAVFKLTHGSGGWTYTSLHDFAGGDDWGYPRSNVIFDADGNLYGTTADAVWEITP